jgi:S1-C subfamily serine protease
VVVTPLGCGTGFFVGERANVITARHVVREDKDQSSDAQPPVFVCWLCTGKGFLFIAPARIVQEDWRTDLALLRLDHPEVLPRPLAHSSIALLESAPAMLRDPVFFETFRRTARGDYEFCRVYGRVAHASALALGGLEQRLITLDVAAWGGASGSPVFSKTGQVVGVLTAMRRDKGQAVMRDSRWILQLLKAAHGDPVSSPAAPLVSFPAPSLVDQPSAVPLPWWQLRRWLPAWRDRHKVITLQLSGSKLPRDFR